MERVGIAIVAACMALGLMFIAPGTSSATVPCEPRSAAHVRDHGGLAADSRWHVAHGELPTCGEQGADSGAVGSGRATASPETTAVPKPAGEDEQKQESRYCRKRIWC